MFKFTRTKRAAGKTYRYVRRDLLNLDEAQGHFQDIKTLAGQHLDPRTRKRGRSESFAHAVERMGLSEEDIASSYRFYSFRFNLFAFFLGVTAALAIWGATQANWFLVVGSVGPTLIFLAMIFNASFRCFQIRHHELLPFSAWWTRRDEWIPGEYLPASKPAGSGQNPGNGADNKVVRIDERRSRPGR